MTYADTFNIRSTAITAAQIGNALDGLLATYSNDTFGSSNSTSGSFVDISGASMSITTATGELLVLASRILLSHSAAGAVFQITFDVDGVDYGSYNWTSHAADTGGDEATLTMFHIIAAPSVGTHTVKLQWGTASGTMYTAGGEIYGLALQTS